MLAPRPHNIRRCWIFKGTRVLFGFGGDVACIHLRRNAFCFPGTQEDEHRIAELAFEVKNASEKRSWQTVLRSSKNMNEEGHWACYRCGKWLPRDSFSKRTASPNGLQPQCKTCEAVHKFAWRCSLRGYALNILGNAKRRSLRLVSKARIHANTYDLDLEKVLGMYLRQEGRCAYSGVVITMRPLSHWQGSLERLVPEGIGYTHENCAWIAMEFQTPTQWCPGKIQVMQELQQQALRKPALSLENDQASVALRHAGIRRALSQVLANARRCAAMRRSRGRSDAGVCELGLIDLLEKLEAQEGLCAISGIRMSLQPSAPWCMSLERFDNAEGYTVNNCCLICREFQSTDPSVTTVDSGRVQGSPQWTSTKSSQIATWLRDPGVQEFVRNQAAALSTRHQAQSADK